MFGITKKPNKPIENKLDPIYFDGKVVITAKIAMNDPKQTILSVIKNQRYFSIRIGKIIELMSPQSTKSALRMLISTELKPNGSNRKLIIAPRLT